MDAFIDDGYTETVGIDAVDGLHPGMEFTYRPFAGDEAAEAFREVYLGPTAHRKSTPRPNPAKEKKRLEAIAREQEPESRKARLMELICRRVSTWSLDRELTPANLNRLNPKLFERFVAIVQGEDIPDYRLDAEGKRIEATEEDAENDAKN